VGRYSIASESPFTCQWHSIIWEPKITLYDVRQTQHDLEIGGRRPSRPRPFRCETAHATHDPRADPGGPKHNDHQAQHHSAVGGHNERCGIGPQLRFVSKLMFRPIVEDRKPEFEFTD
jgi:hypothetical protein